MTLQCSAVERGFLYPEEVAAQVRGGRVGGQAQLGAARRSSFAACALTLQPPSLPWIRS